MTSQIITVCAFVSSLVLTPRLISDKFTDSYVTEGNYRLVMPFSRLVGLFQSNVSCVGYDALW
jgi:hypothetical protein